MYSKDLLNKLIKHQLKKLGKSQYWLAKEIGLTQSNFSRALGDHPGNNLTLPQFGKLIEVLDLSPDQVFYVMTGKVNEKIKEGNKRLKPIKN